MIDIRRPGNDWLGKLEIRLINKRGFHSLLMPVTLKAFFRGLPVSTGHIFRVSMLVPGNNVMEQLLGYNTQDKQQKQERRCNTPQGFVIVQF